MSFSSGDKNYDKNEDENEKTRRRGLRRRRTYQRNDKLSASRPIGVSALAIASIVAAGVMLSSGAYLVAYAPSVHSEWHTLQREFSYRLANPTYLILLSSSLLHLTEENIVTFGAISMALAAVPAIVSFGLFRGRSWSWNASIIFFAVASASLLLTIGSREGGSIQAQGEGIAANAVVQSLVYAGLSIAVLYYLTRPRAKIFFGKAATNDDNINTNTMQHQPPTMPPS